MFSFFKRSTTNYPTPAWASFFNTAEYNQFLDRLKQYFDKEKIPFTLGDGVIEVQDTSFGAERLGLINLAQICRQQPVRKWQNIIQSHFNNMREASLFQDEFNKKAHNFDLIKDYLAVRLYSNDYLSYLDDTAATIGGPVTDDITAILVFDLPKTVVNVKPEQTIQWNKTNEELFEWGRENARKNNPVEISSQTVAGFAIRFIQGVHFFVANTVLDMGRYPELVGTKGSLVGIPHRHAVLVYPIENLEVATAVGKLIPIIRGMFEEGSGGISPNLYWYHANRFTTLPYELSDNKLKFYPPEAFVDMLNILEPK